MLYAIIPNSSISALVANFPMEATPDPCQFLPHYETAHILRMIGQGTIGGRAPRQKRDVKRRRLRTVISNLIMMAGHVTMHARQLIIGLGKSNVWRHIFSDICQKYAVTNA